MGKKKKKHTHTHLFELIKRMMEPTGGDDFELFDFSFESDDILQAAMSVLNDPPSPQMPNSNAIVDVRGDIGKLLSFCGGGENPSYAGAFGACVHSLTRSGTRKFDMPTLLFCKDSQTQLPYAVVGSVSEAYRLMAAYQENAIVDAFGHANRAERLRVCGRRQTYVNVPSRTRTSNTVADFVDCAPADLPTPLMVTRPSQGKTDRFDLVMLLAMACVHSDDRSEGVRLRTEDGTVRNAALLPFTVIRRMTQRHEIVLEWSAEETDACKRRLTGLPFGNTLIGNTVHLVGSASKDKRHMQCGTDLLDWFTEVNLNGSLSTMATSERGRSTVTSVATVINDVTDVEKRFGHALFGRFVGRAMASIPDDPLWCEVVGAADMLTVQEGRLRSAEAKRSTLQKEVQRLEGRPVTRGRTSEYHRLAEEVVSNGALADLISELAEARIRLKAADETVEQLKNQITELRIEFEKAELKWNEKEQRQKEMHEQLKMDISCEFNLAIANLKKTIVEEATFSLKRVL